MLTKLLIRLTFAVFITKNMIAMCKPILKMKL